MKNEILSSAIVAALLLFLPAQATVSFRMGVHGTACKVMNTVAASMRAYNTNTAPHSDRAGRAASIAETEGQVQVINNLKGFSLESTGTEYNPEAMTMSLCQIRPLVFVKDWEKQFIEFRNISLPTKPVFKGQWSMKGNRVEGLLDLDFYGKTVDGTDLDGNETKCFGTIFVAYGSGASIRFDECSILAWQGQGNSVQIAFVGGRSGELYRAVLSFNPVNNTMTITNREPAPEESFGECYVIDGLVFKKSS